ncbi:hypothetical protein AK95_14120 [Paenibacillus sp. LC231]|uniref:hypothetical protein n=1 Tax=unclassified Paenibacillus TaxID=185978 RepID=UPI0008DCE89C|nr:MULTISPECIES: hypothetical protein [unclassified Paenibacillus]MCT1401785.1 hypothetical protein [Paenibacillus sp. p3-SID867]OIB04756.1 hypothetical protein AK95_14120 [Paenibacillus sp. LC231]
MLALLFLVYSLVEWYFAKKKAKAPREKWTVLLLILAFTVWNLFALYSYERLTPNHLIMLLFGWLENI